LRLIVLDEVTTLPEGIARLAKGLGLKPKFRLDDRAHHKTPIRRTAAQDAPHVNDAARGTIEQPQEGWREVEVVDLAVLHITHALVVANRKRQERAHHAAAIYDVAVKQQAWVRNLHFLFLRVDVVHQRIH